MRKTSNDKTKKVLEGVLKELYRRQASEQRLPVGSYLTAQDGQFLGKITTNKYDNLSIVNNYGPYGSKYSATSIFNPYSQYGSKYGRYSLNNPYCQQPPMLYVNNAFKAYVSKNRFVRPHLSTDVFLYNLKENLAGLIEGRIIESEKELRCINKESFIEAADGTYLGSIVPNEFDSNSIFNEFGPYGSEFSPTSIFNSFSKYGSEYSALSPFNEYSSTPPKIYVNGKEIGSLTSNEFIYPRIDPRNILEWAKENLSSFW